MWPHLWPQSLTLTETERRFRAIKPPSPTRLEGFEPPTNGLEVRRSSAELQAPAALA